MKPSNRHLFALMLITLVWYGAAEDKAANSGGNAGDGLVNVGADVLSAGDVVIAAEAWSRNARYENFEGESEDTGDITPEIAVIFDGGFIDANGTAVIIDGSSITIARPGTYRLSGDLADGQILVDSSDQGLVRLIWDGIDVISVRGSVLQVIEADGTLIVLADERSNEVADAPLASTTDPRFPDAPAQVTTGVGAGMLALLQISAGGSLLTDTPAKSYSSPVSFSPDLLSRRHAVRTGQASSSSAAGGLYQGGIPARLGTEQATFTP